MKQIFTLFVLLFGVMTSFGASNDNNVEWNGVQHSPASNVPGTSQTYRTLDYTNNRTIFYLAVYQYDITSANLVWRIGAAGGDTYAAMSYSHTNGSFDYWKVELAKQTQSDIRYVFQINDGSDTDWGGVNGGGTNSVVHDNQPGDYANDVWMFDDTPLPVLLLGFNGYVEQNQTVLKWSTASELNASHFTVYKSSNGVDKNAIGVVTAAGNSNELVDYEFVEVQPVNNVAYYFLEQLDFDGKSEWFGPVKVSKTEAKMITATFGNNNEINISMSDSEIGILQVKLYNMAGQLINASTLTGDRLGNGKLRTEELPSGIYMLYLQGDGMQEAIKLVK